MRLLALALVFVAGSAGAQSIYRCGSTFSQQPCGPDAKQVGDTPPARPARLASMAPESLMVPDNPAAPEIEAAAINSCRERLQRDIAFKDPESVRVGAIQRRGIYHIGDGKTPARVYTIMVNAKNSYGGYTGEKSFMCLTDYHDERRVVLVRPFSE